MFKVNTYVNNSNIELRPLPKKMCAFVVTNQPVEETYIDRETVPAKLEWDLIVKEA